MARTPVFPVSPGVVYSRNDIATWNDASQAAARAALLASGNGSLTKSFSSPGTTISNPGGKVAAVTDSIYALCQAVLFKANANTAHRARCTAVLDAYSAVADQVVGGVTIPGWAIDDALSYRLYASWAADNFTRAAALIGYRRPGFISFLVDATLPILDHVKNFNWHATFSAARLGIAAYAQDADLWDAAKTYCYTRIGQGIYHGAYDLGKVKPCTNSSGVISSGYTVSHWGGDYGAAQVTSAYLPVTPSEWHDGVTAERTRDLGHVQLGLGGYMHALRTIKVQEGVIDTAAYQRLLAAYADQAERVLQFLDDGSFLAPAPVDDEGGPEFQQGWLGAQVLFGPDTPTSVQQMCATSEVLGYAPAGANHLVAELAAP